MPGEAQPNFLFIMTDQHRADWLGCAGHPVLRTPGIDALAGRGVRFDRCYVTNPVCQPNRASLMTGRMPSLHGVRHNGVNLALESNTFVDVLRASGYRTALCGKSHLQNMEDKPPFMSPRLKPGQTLPAGDLAEAKRRPPGAYDQELPSSWNTPGYEMTLPYYGFEHVDLATHHGDEVHGAYKVWLRAQGADHLVGPDAALPNGYAAPQAWRTAVPEELYSTSWVADRTIDQIDRLSKNDDPFFLMMSFPDPHHPFTPPGRYYDMYRPEDMVLPESFVNPGDNPAPPLRWAWDNLSREANPKWGEGMFLFSVDEAPLREAMALTAGMITMIDDAITRVVAHLERAGLADNTVIVFTSDHGDFLGDHRLVLKGPIHFQPLIKVPLIWTDPAAVQHGVTPSIVSTLDIASTVLDRAGITPYNGMQGRSLLDDAASLTENGPGHILIEDDQQRTTLGFEWSPRVHSLVTDRYRMSIYDDTDWGEIYDLVDDPLENSNLWDNAALRAELLETMTRRHIAIVDRSPLPTRVA